MYRIEREFAVGIKAPLLRDYSDVHDANELIFPDGAEQNVSNVRTADVQSTNGLEMQVNIDMEKMLAGAMSNAQKIIQEAHEKSEKIIADALLRKEEIERETFATAHSEGYHAGEQKAIYQYEDMRKRGVAIVEDALKTRSEIIENSEHEVVELALGIAEKILHMEIASSKDAYKSIITDALSSLAASEVVTLYVNPDDALAIDFEDKVATGAGVVDLVVKPVPNIAKGDFLIETDNGSVATGVNFQMDKIRKEFFN